MKPDAPSDSRSRDAQRRFQFVDQCLAALGKTWATSLLQELSVARRSIEGGWPGRLAEARTLAVRELTRHLATSGMAAPSADELASAPSRVNDHARKEWLLALKAQRLARGTGTSRNK
jgi:hypothetical protein